MPIPGTNDTNARYAPVTGRPGRHPWAGRRRNGTFSEGRPALGFTLIELTVIIVLLAVLSFVAIPRIFSDDMRVVPVADRMAAEIRYAQALAMTHGEAHQFRVGGGTFQITRNAGGCGGSGGTVPLSNGESSGNYQGLAVGGSSCINFSSLFGSTGGSHSVQVSSGGGESATIQVESETGYVRVQS